MYQIFDFSTFSCCIKLIYIQRSRNKQIFADPCKIRQRKLKLCEFVASSCTKTVKDREPIFCSNVIWSKYFKKVFHVYLSKKSSFDDIKLRKTLV